MKDLTAVVRAATDTNNPDEYVNRVKTAIREEIKLLDPDAAVEDTRYFNHSAIPDFVVRWGKEKQSRHVFLRDSLENVLAARDAEYIPDAAPAVITLDTRPSAESTHVAMAREMAEWPGALVTTVKALDVMDDADGSSSPLSSLVRSNFVRGARGMIGADEATSLLPEEAAGDAEDGTSAGESSLHALEAAIAKFFDSATALKINRTTELLRLASSSEEDISQSLDAFSGTLDQSDLSRILPWILRDGSELSAPFMSNLGTMFDLADLEELYAELEGLDLTPLITANEDRWVARRAYSGLYIPAEEVAADEGRAPSSGWNFRGKVLGKDLPEIGGRISVAYSGNRLKARPSATSVTWEKVQEKLEAYRLIKVDLRGLRRSVSVNAVQSDDIRQDVTQIATSVEDTYFVQAVTVRTNGPDGSDVDTGVDFGQALAVSDGDCVLGDLVALTEDFLTTSASDVEQESQE